nr:MAG TPA: hypothetical protein [Caudoviricetes sp.]
MSVNKQGIWMYSDSDVVQSWPAFMNLGFNSVSEVVKGLQDGRIVFAYDSTTMNAKIRQLKDTAGKSPDLLIYRADEMVLYMYSSEKLTKIFGGEVETGYVHNNDGFSQWYRYTQHGSGATINESVVVPKAGLWLISPHITVTNDVSANNANIDFLCSVNGGPFNNVGAMNTYTHNTNVYSVRCSPQAVYASTPNKRIAVAMKIQCSQQINIGWGGLTIGATKIG